MPFPLDQRLIISRNLDRLERRCASLTALIQYLNPDLDVEDAVRTCLIPPEGVPTRGYRSRGSPASVDEFEWSEASPAGARKTTLDGMASLPTENTEAGFLGSSILKTVPGLHLEQSRSTSNPPDRTSPTIPTQSGALFLSADLTNSAVLDVLVDAYFTCYNTSYPILHERTFRRKYQDRRLLPSRHSWHAIFYIVLAIGNWIRGGTSGSKQCIYYSAARSYMSMQMLESGTLLTMQVFLLAGNYLQKRDRPNTGYNFIGIAYRMALGLGLHREAPAGTQRDSLYHEQRRVLWWIVYCLDSGFSITTGRPIMCSDGFTETRLPRNLDDSLCTLSSIVPAPKDCPTTYSAIIAQARLASIGNTIYRSVASAPREMSLDLKTSRSLDHQLKAWKLSLPFYFTARDVPDWFRGPRTIIIWKEQNLRMILWWGSQRLCKSPLAAEDAQNMCHYTAIETIQDITTFCLDYPDTIHTGLGWYAIYFLFQATVVLSSHYLKLPQISERSFNAMDNELWTLSISRARDCLANLRVVHEAAARCLAVLDRIQDQSQPTTLATSVGRTIADFNLDNTQVQPISENVGLHPTSFEIDPALQVLFQDTSWNHDIFEGLQGFPIIDEPEVFDYMLPNGMPANTPRE
ncbi:hypothetical protein AOR_1_2318174 [Paecilomyces variotii No. 5]|uniref:Xylanolytic transcriptional activator regulatory domain-containing protein n=1 Tax=Byssochlamys spectabilis (strain No. 5 / NBRC 109023) TaxID=1356009 RepID=V5G5N8_BYSSN|nr:hypothetical protein AOR_1_2318174 [Paecilomyces variotii No. 5]